MIKVWITPTGLAIVEAFLVVFFFIIKQEYINKKAVDKHLTNISFIDILYLMIYQ
ncbi:hypothetical protein [Clostridium sp.]|uniref:hypothetical protein n=1 Tax=Clostridium sp. TaxID=1506 RepID=UPI003D6D15E6